MEKAARTAASRAASYSPWASSRPPATNTRKTMCFSDREAQLIHEPQASCETLKAKSARPQLPTSLAKYQIRATYARPLQRAASAPVSYVDV